MKKIMKSILAALFGIGLFYFASVSCNHKSGYSEDDFERFSAKCDSLWKNDREAYFKYAQTKEYENRMLIYGQWWPEDQESPATQLERENWDNTMALMEAEGMCIMRADEIMKQHGIEDREYAEYRETIDSLYNLKQ